MQALFVTVRPIAMAPKSKLWEHVIDKSCDENGNHNMECIYCGMEFVGGANRILHYCACTGGLSGVGPCSQVPEDLKQQLVDKVAAEKLAKQKRNKLQALGRSSSAPEIVSDQPAAKKQRDGNIRSLLSKSNKHETDRAVARYFYATGTPFNRLNSPYFDEMLSAVASYGPSYRKPHVNALRDTLLAEERASGFLLLLVCLLAVESQHVCCALPVHACP